MVFEDWIDKSEFTEVNCMDEVILNYIELSEEQRKNALMNLKNIGF